jgi:prolyl-tRNA synthetase
MTHEEVMTSIARNELRSYKQLPQIWYQIQTKFRDEPRPKSGLLRVRQFLMKDAYSFDIDEAGLDASYAKHDAAYRRIFTRCGLDFVAVEADSGSMGGSQSQEFMVYTEAGEDLIASCPNGHYAANLEKAISELLPVEDLSFQGADRSIPTPGITTIEDLSEFLHIDKKHLVKTLAFIATSEVSRDGRIEQRQTPVVIFLRGDHKLNEAKLTGSSRVSGRFSGAVEFRPMEPAEIQEFFGCVPGFLGPSARQLHSATLNGVKGFQFFDKALDGRKNMIVGANKEGFHAYTEQDSFPPNETFYDDFRLVNEGEPCPICGAPLKLGKAVEIGHIFKLGYKYSKSMGATVLNKDGKETTPIMGSYGIGIERILTAAIESSAAKFSKELSSRPESPRSGDAVERPAVSSDAYALPPSIAPFQIIVTITNVREPELLAAGEQIALTLESAGFDVLLDDRDERAGVKFKDADLIGVPFRIAVGKKLAEGKVELLNRLTNQTHDISISEITQSLSSLLS